MNPLEIRSVSYRASMYYGLFLGLFLLLRFGLELLGIDNALWSTLYFAMTVAVPFLAYFFLNRFWKACEEPVLRFGQGLSFHFFLFFFASLILALGQYLFYQYVRPDFLQVQYESLLSNYEVLKQLYPPFADIEQEVKEVGAPTASQMAIQNIWIYSLTGIILGLINSWIFTLKHKKQA